MKFLLIYGVSGHLPCPFNALTQKPVRRLIEANMCCSIMRRGWTLAFGACRVDFVLLRLSFKMCTDCSLTCSLLHLKGRADSFWGYKVLSDLRDDELQWEVDRLSPFFLGLVCVVTLLFCVLHVDHPWEII